MREAKGRGSVGDDASQPVLNKIQHLCSTIHRTTGREKLRDGDEGARAGSERHEMVGVGDGVFAVSTTRNQNSRAVRQPSMRENRKRNITCFARMLTTTNY